MLLTIRKIIVSIIIGLFICIFFTEISKAQFRGYDWGTYIDDTNFKKTNISNNVNSFNIVRHEVLANKYSAQVTYTFSKKSASGEPSSLSELLKGEYRLTSGSYKFEFSDIDNSRYYEINDILKVKYGEPDESEMDFDESLGFRVRLRLNVWRTDDTIIKHQYKDYEHYLYYYSIEHSKLEEKAELSDF